jgi:hypothetical protein
MRRTLLAVGFAVLASLLHVPEGYPDGTIHHWRPFWEGGHILVTPLILQTVFAAVALALVVDIRWWPRRKRPTTVPGASPKPPEPPPPQIRDRYHAFAVFWLCAIAFLILMALLNALVNH